MFIFNNAYFQVDRKRGNSGKYLKTAGDSDISVRILNNALTYNT